MAALWPVGVQRPAPRHMRKSTSPQNDTLNGPGRPRRMTPRLLRGPTGSVGARHGPWATKRRARPRNGGATAARRAGGACIAPRATPIPTGRTARGKKCAPCPCPRRPGCLAGLRVSRPGSAPFASTPPPPLPILGPKMASGGGAWRAEARAGAGPRTWDSACGRRPMVPSGVRGVWPRPSTHARATPAPGGHRSDPRGPTRAVSGGYDLDWDSTPSPGFSRFREDVGPDGLHARTERGLEESGGLQILHPPPVQFKLYQGQVLR